VVFMEPILRLQTRGESALPGQGLGIPDKAKMVSSREARPIQILPTTSGSSFQLLMEGFRMLRVERVRELRRSERHSWLEIVLTRARTGRSGGCWKRWGPKSCGWCVSPSAVYIWET
jgi:hypothetical protein